MKPKIKKSQTRKWKMLNFLANSLWSQISADPTFDIRREYAPRFDRQRSAGGLKLHED